MSLVYLGSEQPPDENPEPAGPKRVHKFIIMSLGTQIQFVYGPLQQFAYHAGLVKKYCEINDIPSGWLKKPDVYEIYSADYQIRGGGWMEEDLAEKTVRLYGYSTAYGAFDPGDIPHLFEPGEALADYEIQVDQ